MSLPPTQPPVPGDRPTTDVATAGPRPPAGAPSASAPSADLGDPLGPPAPPAPPSFDAVPPEPPSSSQPPRRGRRALGLVGALALAAASATGGAALALALDDDPEPEGVSSLDVAPPEVGAATDEPDEGLSQVAAAVLPSVVSITVEVGPGVGQGAGVIISDDGMIVTNNHVVEAAADGDADLSVTFSDGESADAEIVGRDPATDLAVIQAEDVSGLTPATLGTSEQLNVGDTVVAIGSPLGLNGSVTSGIVSAVDRAITLSGSDQPPFGQDREDEGPTAVIDAIQTDAAINPGNSGGALVNADGEVIGIPTAIASTAGGATAEGGNIGVGFAIAIDDARDIVDQLIDEGEVAHAFLGVEIGDAEGGAVVGRVEPGSPADEAGIEEGDLITALDDQDIDDATALTSAVRSHSPDDEVTVTFTRDDDEQTVDVTLGTLPG